MTVKLKQLLKEGLAGIDQSHGTDTLYDLLLQIITDQKAIITSHNQLLTDYNNETLADHTTSSAASVTSNVEVE